MTAVVLGGVKSYRAKMPEVVFPFSGYRFHMGVSAMGVRLIASCEPLFPSAMSDEEIDQGILELQAELVAIAPEMKAQLRKLREALFGEGDA